MLLVIYSSNKINVNVLLLPKCYSCNLNYAATCHAFLFPHFHFLFLSLSFHLLFFYHSLVFLSSLPTVFPNRIYKFDHVCIKNRSAVS